MEHGPGDSLPGAVLPSLGSGMEVKLEVKEVWLQGWSLEVVEEEPGGEGGHQQRQGGREPLQDVVSVLDGRRHQQTPACTAELSANIIHLFFVT